jgi:hypothetical protein
MKGKRMACIIKCKISEKKYCQMQSMSFLPSIYVSYHQATKYDVQNGLHLSIWYTETSWKCDSSSCETRKLMQTFNGWSYENPQGEKMVVQLPAYSGKWCFCFL